jgi:hypothetical protein
MAFCTDRLLTDAEKDTILRQLGEFLNHNDVRHCSVSIDSEMIDAVGFLDDVILPKTMTITATTKKRD